MTYDDISKILHGQQVTTTVSVTVTKDKLTMGTGTHVQEFKKVIRKP